MSEGLASKTRKKAGEIRRKACEAKEGISCFNLGDNAILSEKDVASAKNYLQNACAYGRVTVKRRKR